MAYYVNGKTYTDHPLMDEICYYCKLILKGIVIKNDVLAAQKETQNSITNAEMYFIQHDNGNITFEQMYFTKEMLTAYGCTDAEIKAYLTDRNNINEEIRDDLTAFCNNWFRTNFEEENDYYRMLMGLPPYNTGEEYYIYLDESDIPSSYYTEVDFTLPLHKQPESLINVIYNSDSINNIRNNYPGSNYSYMLYLGDKSIDLYKARKAGKWEVLYIPNVYYLVENRFLELYSINRQLYINKSYQEFFAETGEYYDQMMIMVVLAQTFNDLVAEIPEWYIRRDIFDIRSCKYFLDANGVEFFKEIPLKYQIRIVKNLNKLIKYKSSTKNIEDILDIFDSKGLTVYKYWLYKKFVYSTSVTPGDEDITDDLVYNYGDLDEEDETANGNYDFDDLDEGTEPDSIVKGNYDFNNPGYVPSTGDSDDDEESTVIVITNDDDYVFNFGDLDNYGETEAEGDYNFGELEDAGIPKSSVAVDDYDFNFLCDDNNLVPEEYHPAPPKIVDNSYYDLEFVKSPIKESYDNYLREAIYHNDYYSVTEQDKYWVGEDTASHIKEQILEKDFTINGTKYLGIEYNIPIDDFIFQSGYFGGLLLDSNLNTIDLTVNIPTISEMSSFTMSNLYLFLSILTNAYEGINDVDIRYIDGYTGNTLDIGDDDSIKAYNWKKNYTPEIYTSKTGRVCSFNTNVDKDALILTLEQRHSHLRFGDPVDDGYRPLSSDEYKEEADTWIEEIGVTDYIVPNGSIDNITDLINIYKNNKICYDKLKDAMVNSDNEDELRTLNYVYQELYTREFDKQYYLLSDGNYANSLIDIIKDRDPVLYSLYLNIISESNMESRQDVIRSVMNDILDTLNYYLTDNGLDYLFSFTSIESFESLVQYVNLLVGFFKSYKVYFVDPIVSLEANDTIQNSVAAKDSITEWNYYIDHTDSNKIHDAITGINEESILKDTHVVREMSDIYQYYSPDPFDDQDYDGTTAEEGEDGFTDIDGAYAADYTTYPYIMINCNYAYEGVVVFDDVDGGAARESYEDYYEVDGGYAYDSYDFNTDMMGSQMFTYFIDGGGAGDGNRSITRTAETIMVGNTIYVYVRVSDNENNRIQTLKDGLYLADEFLDQSQFNNFVASVENVVSQVRNDAVTIETEIDNLLDEDSLVERIKGVSNQLLYDIEYSLQKMSGVRIGGTLIAELENYIDGLTDTLEKLYSVDPYAWEDL